MIEVVHNLKEWAVLLVSLVIFQGCKERNESGGERTEQAERRGEVRNARTQEQNRGQVEIQGKG